MAATELGVLGTGLCGDGVGCVVGAGLDVSRTGLDVW